MTYDALRSFVHSHPSAVVEMWRQSCMRQLFALRAARVLPESESEPMSAYSNPDGGLTANDVYQVYGEDE